MRESGADPGGGWAGGGAVLDDGNVLARGRAFVRRQYFVMLIWGLMNAVMLVVALYALYQLFLIFTQYARNVKSIDDSVVAVSNDLFNAAMDDEPADADAIERARVPAGADIMRRARKYEAEGGATRDLLGSMDPSTDKYPAVAKPGGDDDE